MKNLVIFGAAAVLIVGGGYWLMNRDSVSESKATNSEISKESEIPSESVTTLDTGTYKVDEEQSKITWQAGKPAITGYVHTGMFSLTENSEFVVTEQSLTGEVVIDMNSLDMLSLGGGKAGQESTLEGHLKGERFFDVATYPTATFRVTDISPKVLPSPENSDYTATGELTMKGMTKTISFPIKVTVVSENEAWMTAQFSIDRTEWGLTAGSAKVAEAITDQIIGDTVTLDLSVRLSK